MPAIGSLVTFSPNTYIKSSDVNANFSAIVSAFNTSAVLTDLAKTITVAHTFSQGATFSGGTVNFSGATVSNLTANITGNATGSAATVTAAAQPAITSLGTQAHDLLFVDATYDIGKIGATRPRDFFTSRNITAGQDCLAVRHLEHGDAVGGASNANARLAGSLGTLGFFNTASAGIQTVTGSRGSNAALASLLAALSAYGLIVNSSS